ncbi:GLIPR1-like protein 1 [Triplophysa rosa]|uniref:GLIPR1-like protein 1 n=1 Tax=Triplophysa rosa TaxID=992332 RepID=UPI002545C578|nr:GLIPR1-like protein 1 [Triplophysa rosa]
MSDSLHILLCVTVLLLFFSHSRTAEPFFDITDPAFINECIKEHNRYRANVMPAASNMRYMTWDEALAISARAWASNCIFKHNPHLQQPGRMHPTFTPVGENIWAGFPYSKFTVNSAMKLWGDEVKDYSYNSNQCTNVCGHFTQVVWADTYKVGCAAQACPNGVVDTSFSSNPGIIFVCNYATAGNYPGVHPYRNRKSCSDCNGEKCETNLCRNSTRDALKSYNWRPDWDPALFSCGSFCKALLVIRPASILLIFLSVFCLQRYYTKLFVYE